MAESDRKDLESSQDDTPKPAEAGQDSLDAGEAAVELPDPEAGADPVGALGANLPEEEYSENEHAEATEETGASEAEAVPDAAEEAMPEIPEDAVDATEAEAQPEAADPAPKPDPAPVVPPPPPAVERVVERRGGFVPGLLGGLIGGAVIFGAAQYMTGGWPFATTAPVDYATRAEMQSALAGQSTRIDGAEAAARAAVQPPALDSAVAGLKAQLGGIDALKGQIGDMGSRLDDLSARVTALEKAPMENSVSDAAVAAYEAELKKLQDSVAAQRAEMEAMARSAAEMEQNAAATAHDTMVRSAVTRILSALDSGTPFGPALNDLAETGTQVPEVLRKAAADGVAPQSLLIDRFPEVAREALAAARETEGDGGSFSGFLARQLGARSVAPRDGADPDAVLSRAEAAVKEGRLADALAEIQTLPAPAQAAMADWVTAATLRRDALDAAESLAQSLN